MPAGQARGLIVMTSYPAKLGIVAGGGDLPKQLLSFCDSRNIETFIVAFDGHTDSDTCNGRDHAVMRLGEAGKIVKLFRDKGFNDLVLIGSIKRPNAWELRPDFYTARFFAKVGFKAMGDDGLLKAIRYALEDEGFVIHGIHEFIPSLLMSQGAIGQCVPTQEESDAIAVGYQAAKDLGQRDVGQCVVVHNGQVIGEESAKGTDELIRRCAVKGAILVKTCKPQQDRKLDLPTIGRRTVRLCAELGYAGIAAEAGSTLLANGDEVRQIADSTGLFVVGV